MSLDFYLYEKREAQQCECTCGHKHLTDVETTLESFNITHNLGNMAHAAGIYECLWRPEEQTPPITTAAQCIPILRDGLAVLRGTPGVFRPMSAANGWGTYEQFVPWVEKVLAACEANPNALVGASR
jgi:hypothetical protein